MKLTTAQVRDFRSIDDSEPFDVGDITCLVGKNESGKTALLHALYRMNPIVEADAGYSLVDDYPRVRVEDYKQDLADGARKSATVTEAKFALDDDDIETLSAYLGECASKAKTLKVTRGYEADLQLELPISEATALKGLLQRYDLPTEVAQSAGEKETLAEVLQALQPSEPSEAAAAAHAALNPAAAFSTYLDFVLQTIIKPRLPKFLYFDEYYQMRGCENVEALKERQTSNALRPSDHPLLGLIQRARLDVDALLNTGRTRDLKNRLEGASNHLTKQIIDYWSQNEHLQLLFDVRQARPEDPDGMRQGTNIWAEVRDAKHFVTTEMGTRSKGFIWFFSFLAWYGEIRRQGKDVILLLDEPGLSLHGRAQQDLLKYFDAEIQGKHQLIYSTHSPFMVDPTRLDRVRIVQDLSIERGPDPPPEKAGTRVTTEVLDATEDSLFPLQGALGYEITQTLFVGPNCLVVEGVSDMLFLQGMSYLLEEEGRAGLSEEWVITPVGGSDKVPTFVALLGAQRDLNVAVLVDFHKTSRQMVENLYKKKLLEKKHVRTYADFTGTTEADVEDMFDVDFYLLLVNGAFKGVLHTPVTKAALNASMPRITRMLSDHFEAKPLKGGRIFRHLPPAKYFVKEVGVIRPADDTLDRFEAAFIELNSLLGK